MESISNIGISEAQQRVEQTPSDLIVPPTATGTYQVDESVIEGRLAEAASETREAMSILTTI